MSRQSEVAAARAGWTLTRSWDVRVVVDDVSSERTERDTVEGWPAVGPVALVALRRRIHDRRCPASEPLRWWHDDGCAWAAVTDLHRVGEHAEAVALARLLRWCRQHYSHEQVRVWTLTEVGSA